MWEHSDKVRDYVFNPRNVGVLESPDAEGEAGTLRYGDALKLGIKVDSETGVITAARFKTFGCGAAIAAASALTDMVVGKTVDEAAEITNVDIVAFLGGLPPEKMYCSVLGYEALQAALARYRGVDPEDRADKAALVCKCFAARKDTLERTIRANRLTAPEQVTFYTKASGGCRGCLRPIEELLARVNAEMVGEGLIAADDAYRAPVSIPRILPAKFQMNGQANGKTPPKPPGINEANGVELARQGASPTPKSIAAFAKLKPEERIELISSAIEELRPHLKADGGDCELVEIKDNTAFVKLTGACIGCQMASVTLSGVQQRLIEKTGMPLRVVPVQ
jgi:NifU-like protein